MKALWHRFTDALRRTRDLGKAGERGATAGLLAAIVIFYIFLVAANLTAAAPNLLVLPAALLRLGHAVVAAGGIALIFALIRRRLPRLRFVLFLTLAFSLLLEYLGTPVGGVAILIAGLATFPVLLCWGVAALRASRSARLSRGQRWTAALAVVLGLAGCVFGGVRFFGDGYPVPAPANAALEVADLPPTLDLADPSQPGPHRVQTLSYGSDHDRWRSEYGASANLITKPVDGSGLAEGWTGLTGWTRTRFWGFDLKTLPLQARVWCPEGSGPFPLVVVTHGSHPMEDFSESGYAYLGEILASRGFIVASVDENFLNPSFADGGLLPWSGGRLRGEIDLRAWLLLEHLRQWREWNASPGNVFFRRVDLDRVSLIGHSKGGEAIAVAAAFNRMRFDPDDFRIAFDYGFGIRALVAIAPTDGLHRPATLATKLEDLSYLTLHGSNDMDVQSFVGSKQFARLAFSGDDDFLKETVYIYGANHGQFNTVWGRTDYSRSRIHLFNRRPLLPGAEQRKVAATFTSAFLEATLHHDRRYVAFLRDPRSGRNWLPRTILLTDFQDSATRMVASFEEDVDLTTTTLPGGTIRGENLALWREGMPRIKWGPRDTSAVFLGWDREASANAPRYAITLPDGALRVDARSALVFSAADTAERLPGRGQGRPGAAAGPIDFSIELADRAGASARLALGSSSYLQPLMRVQVAKLACLGDAPPSEPTFQSFELSLAAFVRANPAFKPEKLESITFIFDRTPRRVIGLDAIGLRPGSPGTP